MGRPQGNGLIELVDEKSHDRGFFCMQLAAFIQKEKHKQLTLDPQDLWDLRFREAKAGQCAYRDICHIHARTIAKREKRPIQLTINF